MKNFFFLFALVGALAMTSCNKDDDDPQIKNLKVCTQLSGSSCDSHNDVISSTASQIVASAELDNVTDANVTISMWAWDGTDWVSVTQVSLNNGDKNVVNATFTNTVEWPTTDYEIDFVVEDPSLSSTIAFTVE